MKIGFSWKDDRVTVSSFAYPEKRDTDGEACGQGVLRDCILVLLEVQSRQYHGGKRD